MRGGSRGCVPLRSGVIKQGPSRTAAHARGSFVATRASTALPRSAATPCSVHCCCCRFAARRSSSSAASLSCLARAFCNGCRARGGHRITSRQRHSPPWPPATRRAPGGGSPAPSHCGGNERPRPPRRAPQRAAPLVPRAAPPRLARIAPPSPRLAREAIPPPVLRQRPARGRLATSRPSTSPEAPPAAPPRRPPRVARPAGRLEERRGRGGGERQPEGSRRPDLAAAVASGGSRQVAPPALRRATPPPPPVCSARPKPAFAPPAPDSPSQPQPSLPPQGARQTRRRRRAGHARAPPLARPTASHDRQPPAARLCTRRCLRRRASLTRRRRQHAPRPRAARRAAASPARPARGGSTRPRAAPSRMCLAAPPSPNARSPRARPGAACGCSSCRARPARLRPRPASLEARQPCRPRLVATPQQSALLVHDKGSPSAMPPSPNASATSSAKCGSPRRLLELSFGSWIRRVCTRGTPRRASEAARERRAPAAE
mmetsp:Transcript_45949/g.144499  ORF Transcript_45949/g.144499 Transcript_45949/m.144499 type:complete len:489 (+) Transcript_45949:66-1532(+)